MKPLDHINFFRNARAKRATENRARELRERAVRGEELAKDVPKKSVHKPAQQIAMKLEK